MEIVTGYGRIGIAEQNSNKKEMLVNTGKNRKSLTEMESIGKLEAGGNCNTNVI